MHLTLTLLALVTPLPLEELLRPPHPMSLVAAQKGDKVAMSTIGPDGFGVWVAAAPDFTPKSVGPAPKDDGQWIGDLAFSADGTQLAYVRGGSADREGLSPNPTGDPAGARQEVFVVPAAGGEAHAIGEGAEPIFSPDGKTLVYVAGGQIMSASVDRSQPAAPLFRARGNCYLPRFSPDGKLLSFVSDRGDHAWVGVYDLGAKKVTWMAPGVDRDGPAVWSPDGKRVAFLRVPGRRIDPVMETEPTSRLAIFVADAASGDGLLVWSSPEKSKASAFAVEQHTTVPLLWADADRLVFYWEGDGWIRLYSVDSAGGDAVALTPEKCEVADASLSLDRKELMYDANCDDADRRHLWSVPVAGGSPRSINGGGDKDGLAWSPVALARGFAFIGATAKRPPQISVSTDGAVKRIGDEWFKSFPEALVEPQAVTFKSSDGVEIHGQLFVPPGSEDVAKHPAVVFLHGDPTQQMVLGFHPGAYHSRGYAMNQHLASRGNVVLAVNYRGGSGYGEKFRRSPKLGPFGASEYQDVQAAVRFLTKRPDVDAKRVGVWGGSYGGWLAALGLAKDSHTFAAGVVMHGISDWAELLRRQGLVSPGPDGEAALKKAKTVSPASMTKQWTSPVLFIHGDDDRAVEFHQTTDLVERLRDNGTKTHVELLVLPDEGHLLWRHDSWVRALRTAADFLERGLAEKVKTSSAE